jgi:hypothetical protein
VVVSHLRPIIQVLSIHHNKLVRFTHENILPRSNLGGLDFKASRCPIGKAHALLTKIRVGCEGWQNGERHKFKLYLKRPEVVFLFICDPSMNKL